ncbi:MAG: acyl-CoA desaturase [Deltaproteobacteria bacterium]|nr:acyl-CoA desaturase [Deltaproteobacteria bacterium]MBU51012.1 acyl-CoA desaturase [Deltaproteobacteria bacterium]
MTKKIQFTKKSPFSKELKRRVDAYFQEQNLSPRDQPKMYLKTVIILSWTLASYALLLFGPAIVWFKFLMAASLGAAMAGVGFSIMHDGGHRSYSTKNWINRIAFFSLDMLGASSYIWNWKHNVFHHTYPNIVDHDDDLNVGVFGRLAPEQTHYKFHQYQHIYLWFLYGLLPAKWHLFDDFEKLYTGRMGVNSFPRPKGWDLFVFFSGKILFFTWAFVIPSMFYSFWVVCAFYLFATFIEGVLLAVVFQLAHCLEEADFPMPNEYNKIDDDFLIHQLHTTADFAPNNKLLSWYVGGLNFQVEHHLFPKVSHIHYPALAKIVEETCNDYGIQYHCHATFWGSLRSHYNWLVRLGKNAEQVAPSVAEPA